MAYRCPVCVLVSTDLKLARSARSMVICTEKDIDRERDGYRDGDGYRYIDKDRGRDRDRDWVIDNHISVRFQAEGTVVSLNDWNSFRFDDPPTDVGIWMNLASFRDPVDNDEDDHDNDTGAQCQADSQDGGCGRIWNYNKMTEMYDGVNKNEFLQSPMNCWLVSTK